MGTVFSLDIRTPGVEPGVVDEAIELLHELDARFSPYRPDSEISRIRSGEITAEHAHPEVRFVIAECARLQAATDGYFSAYASGLFDPSGYVKGWAIERVSDLLRSAGSTSHCVNGGGDVQCVGIAGDKPWRVGISDPRAPGALVTTIAGQDLAVATSGTAERGSHILDPHTGLPVENALLSLTVTGRAVTICDAYATAGFAMGTGARAWFSKQHSVLALGIAQDGTMWSTFPGSRGPAAVNVPQLAP